MEGILERRTNAELIALIHQMVDRYPGLGSRGRKAFPAPPLQGGAARREGYRQYRSE